MWIASGGAVEVRYVEDLREGVAEPERHSESESELAILARWRCWSNSAAWISSDA